MVRNTSQPVRLEFPAEEEGLAVNPLSEMVAPLELRDSFAYLREGALDSEAIPQPLGGNAVRPQLDFHTPLRLPLILVVLDQFKPIGQHVLLDRDEARKCAQHVRVGSPRVEIGPELVPRSFEGGRLRRSGNGWNWSSEVSGCLVAVFLGGISMASAISAHLRRSLPATHR